MIDLNFVHPEYTREFVVIDPLTLGEPRARNFGMRQRLFGWDGIERGDIVLLRNLKSGAVGSVFVASLPGPFGRGEFVVAR